MTARLSASNLDDPIAVVVGDAEAAVAARALRAGAVAAYVVYKDASGRVLVERYAINEALAAQIDQAVALAAMDFGVAAYDVEIQHSDGAQA